MLRRSWLVPPALLGGCLLVIPLLFAQFQPPNPPGGPGGPPPGGPGEPPPFGPGGPPFGRGGRGGPPGMGGQERKILKQYDRDGNGWLNQTERAAAREEMRRGGGEGRGRGGFGPRGFGRGNENPPQPGPHLDPSDVAAYPDKPLYEPTVLRTLFLEFENKDWESELEEFHGTDVEVPATLTVDGKKYPNVGVHFRGMSSYMGVPAGYKRSLNLALDLADPKQRLYGYKTLNLLNSHEDSSFLSTVLYSHIARQHIPAPKANLVKVVINGESWGVYSNVQQFNKEFLSENYKTTRGTRWKVRGSPGGGGGLDYIGDNIEDYRRRYEIKSGEDAKAWKALVNLCRVLHETPTEKLQAALEPILDIDSLLWFLAADVTLSNGDGYWVRASDYSIYLDPKGKFHVIPHDMNEAFHGGGGPGMGGPPGGRGGPGGFGPPRPGELLPGPLAFMLELTPEQQKQLEQLQKEVDGKLAKLLTPEQNRMLKDMQERGPEGFGPPGGPPGFGPPGGPGGPGGFRPGGPDARGPGEGRGPEGRGPGGPGRGGRGPGMGGGGVQLDPLVALNDDRKPLRSKVLAVPALREKYLRCVRTLAEESLDWKKLGPIVARYRKLIDSEVKADTRKLSSYEAFLAATADVKAEQAPTPGRRGGMSLREFAEQRRNYLLNHPEIKKLDKKEAGTP